MVQIKNLAARNLAKIIQFTKYSKALMAKQDKATKSPQPAKRITERMLHQKKHRAQEKLRVMQEEHQQTLRQMQLMEAELALTNAQMQNEELQMQVADGRWQPKAGTGASGVPVPEGGDAVSRIYPLEAAHNLLFAQQTQGKDGRCSKERPIWGGSARVRRREEPEDVEEAFSPHERYVQRGSSVSCHP